MLGGWLVPALQRLLGGFTRGHAGYQGDANVRTTWCIPTPEFLKIKDEIMAVKLNCSHLCAYPMLH